MVRFFALVLGTMAALAALPLSAATLSINGLTGTWGNITTTGGPQGALTGGGTSHIKWGVPYTGTQLQSGYSFLAGGPSTQTVSGSFLIGEFQHTNGTIFSKTTSLTGADLSLSLSGAANGTAFALQSAFHFIHNETLNSANPCPAGGAGPCADPVQISSLFGSPLTITSGGNIFTLMIDGFVTQLGGALVSSLITPELATKSLFLQASLSIANVPPPPPPPPPPAVPLPAGIVLLGAALGGLGLARRGRKH